MNFSEEAPFPAYHTAITYPQFFSPEDFDDRALVGRAIPAGQLLGAVCLIPVTDDAIVEDIESFRLTLQLDANSPAVLGRQSTAVAQIVDNDSKRRL